MGQPVLALTLQGLAPGRIATGLPVLRSPVCLDEGQPESSLVVLCCQVGTPSRQARCGIWQSGAEGAASELFRNMLREYLQRPSAPFTTCYVAARKLHRLASRHCVCRSTACSNFKCAHPTKPPKVYWATLSLSMSFWRSFVRMLDTISLVSSTLNYPV